MKKGIVIGILFVVLIGLGYAYYTTLVQGSEKLELAAALPNKTGVFLASEDLFEFYEKLSEKPYSNDFISTVGLTDVLPDIKLVDSLIGQISNSGIRLKDREAIVAFYPVEAGKMDQLYLVDLKKTDQEQFRAAVKKLSSIGFTVGSRNYKGDLIQEVKDSAGTVWYCSYTMGVLSVSHSAILIETALLHLQDRNGLYWEKSYQDLANSPSIDADVSLFVNYQELGGILPRGGEQESVLPVWMNSLASKSRLDLTFLKNGISINGYTQPLDGKLLDGKQHGVDGQIDLGYIMPLNVAAVLQSPIVPKTWLSGTKAQGYTRSLDEKIEEEGFLVLPHNDKEEALKGLSVLIGNDSSTAITNEIGTLTNGKKIAEVFDSEGVLNEEVFYAITEEFLLFCNTQKELNSWLKDVERGRVLSSDLRYNSFKEKLSATVQYSLYLDASQWEQVVQTWLGKGLEGAAKSAAKFSPAALQFNYFNGSYLTSGRVGYMDEPIKADPVGLWQVNLEAAAMGKVHVVKTHLHKSKELLVQDSSSQLYLIDRGGSILWKKKLNAPILGGIRAIDYYKNGKLQYVFNTTDKLYIIDHNGNNVGNFPLKLPAKATNGVLVVNYDRNRNYRYFIACANGNIYGYYPDGKPLPGWDPKKRAGRIIHRMQHILVGGKDYIIAYNQEGDLFFFDRQGKKRVKPMLLKTLFPEPFSVTKSSSGFTMTNIDTSGAIYTVNQAGKVNKTGSIVLDSLDLTDFFYSDLLSADGNEYLTVTNRSFLLSNSKGEELSKLDLEETGDWKVTYVESAKEGSASIWNSTSSTIMTYDRATLTFLEDEVTSTIEPLVLDLLGDGQLYTITADGKELSVLPLLK